MRRRAWTSQGFVLVLAMAAVAATTAVFRLWLAVRNPTIAALTYLLVVLVTATASTLGIAIACAIIADLSLNYFFMPPVGTFTIADPQNVVALIVFLAVSVIATNLSTIARDRTREAIARRDELARLFDLSRDILLTTDSREAVAQLARYIALRFKLDRAAICLPRANGWEILDSTPVAAALDEHQLSMAFTGASQALEFDAQSRVYSGHRMLMAGGEVIRLVPLRLGHKTVGLLAAAGRDVEPGTLDALGGIAAIAIERAQLLDERKNAELARQSEALKSALLASLGHDLRTPLTAIKVAASNLQATWLGDAERREQSDLILAEVERLSRLFQNILDMARIDAGGVTTDLRWVHPSEIVEAARDQVEHTLRPHQVEIASDTETLVRLDPRLTASALAHVLENAAQYSPASASIAVSVAIVDEGLRISVRDRGPGIAPADLPHLFERFYRGSEARRRVSGTGMGLSIARGMLAAQGGRIWAENCADGGAQFTIVVPAERKPATAAIS